MQSIDVKKLRSGLILSNDIVVNGKVVAKKNSVINDSLISSLSSLSDEISLVYVYDLFELKPIVLHGNETVRQYINFLVSTFNNIFNTALVDNSRIDVLLNMLESYFLSNRKLLYETIVLRDNHCYTFEHSVNVAMYGLLIGLSEGLTDRELKTLIYGCLLHDIGKLNISNSLLDKPTKLNESEFLTIKQHPLFGKSIYRTIGVDDKDVESIIVQHHEKLDGTGYPNNLSSGRISHLAKIAAVSDIFDAVTSKRAYHKKRSTKDGIEILNSDSSHNKISKDEVTNLIKNLVIYPVNTIVSLNNGVTGYVVEDCRTMYPKVMNKNGVVYDLNKRRDLKVIEIL